MVTSSLFWLKHIYFDSASDFDSNFSPESNDTESYTTLIPGSSNDLDAGLNSKAKITALPDDGHKSVVVPDGPSTDTIHDSTTVSPDNTSTAIDDTPAIAKVAPVSVDLMTWSVFAAKGMTLPVTKLLGTSVWKSEVCLLVTRHTIALCDLRRDVKRLYGGH